MSVLKNIAQYRQFNLHLEGTSKYKKTEMLNVMADFLQDGPQNNKRGSAIGYRLQAIHFWSSHIILERVRVRGRDGVLDPPTVLATVAAAAAASLAAATATAAAACAAASSPAMPTLGPAAPPAELGGTAAALPLEAKEAEAPVVSCKSNIGCFVNQEIDGTVFRFFILGLGFWGKGSRFRGWGSYFRVPWVFGLAKLLGRRSGEGITAHDRWPESALCVV